MKLKFSALILMVAAVVACNQKKAEEKVEEPAIEKSIERPKDIVVKGIVKNADTEESISMAMVMVVGTTTGTLTGPDGKFQITAPATAKKISISNSGYESVKIDVSTDEELVVKLKPKK